MGTIIGIVWIRDANRKSKCFDFVNFKNVGDVIKAFNGKKIDDDKLKKLFSQFDSIKSCKVLQDLSEISSGLGIVAFSTPVKAFGALLKLNKKMVFSKPLYVTLAQHK